MPRRVLIVGGVAGGASAAARLRRLDEEAEIVLFDRGPHVSFANCGLPYFVGNVIADERKLLVASPQLFQERFAIAVRTRHEVVAIDRAQRTIPDSVRIRRWIEERKPTRALVIGGGFIGLEMAENLAARGLRTTVLEKLAQVMPPFDPEMAFPVAEHLRERGVELRLGDGIASF